MVNKSGMRGVGCSTHGEMRSSCNILVAKPKGKVVHGKSKHRWEDNYIDFGEIWCESVN
jgi:hypothetical protein